MRMTNDQFLMTKECPRPNDQSRVAFAHWGFVIPSTLVLRP